MKIAIIGSRSLTAVHIDRFIPKGAKEIISGGAKGIDCCAKEYAMRCDIKMTEFLPEYEKYGRAAPLKRNEQIVDYADLVIAFWDGKSRGTENVIRICKRKGKAITVIKPQNALPE